MVGPVVGPPGARPVVSDALLTIHLIMVVGVCVAVHPYSQ